MPRSSWTSRQLRCNLGDVRRAAKNNPVPFPPRHWIVGAYSETSEHRANASKI